MSIIYFQVTCIFFSILLVILYFTKKKFDNIENRVFGKMIIVNFIGLVLDIVTYFILEYFSFYYLSLLFCKLILFFLLCWISLLTFYILYISYGNSDNYNKYNKFIKLIFIISSLLVFVLPLKVVYVDNHFYSVGIATQYLYFVSFAYIFLWIIMLTKNIKNIFNKKYYPIFAYMNIGIIVIIIQYNFPWLLLMVPMETFVTYLLYFTIENPDMKLLEEVHKSKEISDAANEEKTLFLYNMTQEIRNTTNEIDDNANIILDSDSIETDKDCAREIKGITSKFRTMTNEMFDVSKLDSASIKVYNSKYNIKNILKEIVTMYCKICKDKNIDFRVNIDRDVPEVLYGDSINVKEVLSIIMDNSVKYTKEGFIEFNVSTIIKNNVCRLIITIEDSGVGIKSDDINKIKIGDKSLSKANKLVTLMNGAMMVSSNYGMGTKVKVILDQKIELQVNEDVAKYSEIYDNIKILMVDDSEAGIKIIEKLIKGSNIKMDFAMNGRECVDKIRAHSKYDVILLDEQLTQINASELLMKIKTIRNFDIPVILLTKDNSYEYNDEYKKLGFSDYILKPVKKDELLRKIDMYVKKDK